ncbi:MAG: DNA-binding response regulator [Sandaracinus sp.]|nr:DNA-binding response regulator [Sandaracinus sp.]
MPSPAMVLVVEDDPPTAASMVRALKRAGHRVELAVDGQLALEALQREAFDLVILDLRLPRTDGLEVLEVLRGADRQRTSREVGVLVVSASTELESRLRSFALGADDFVPKPFWTEELVARVERRLARDRELAEETWVLGSLELDAEALRVRVDGATLDLTVTERALLGELARARGAAVPRETLAARVLDGQSRTVDSHVARLRRKLGAAGPLVRTVWGIGYRLAVDA